MQNPKINNAKTLRENLAEHVKYAIEKHQDFPCNEKRIDRAMILFEELGEIAKAENDYRENRITSEEYIKAVGSEALDAMAVICRIFEMPAEDALSKAVNENHAYSNAVKDGFSIKTRITSAFRAASMWLSMEEWFGLNCAMIDLSLIVKECLEVDHAE